MTADWSFLANAVHASVSNACKSHRLVSSFVVVVHPWSFITCVSVGSIGSVRCWSFATSCFIHRLIVVHMSEFIVFTFRDRSCIVRFHVHKAIIVSIVQPFSVSKLEFVVVPKALLLDHLVNCKVTYLVVCFLS